MKQEVLFKYRNEMFERYLKKYDFITFIFIHLGIGIIFRYLLT